MQARALIVTYYWPPSGGPGVQRYLKFAKYLPEYNVEPFILTVSNPTYPIRDPSLADEIPDHLTIYKSKTIEPFGLYAGLSGDKAEKIAPTIEIEGDSFKSMIGSWIRANIFIPDARAGWLITAKRKAAEIVQKHQIGTVITTGPPHSVHFIGKHLQQKEAVRWLADFRDPWSRVYYNQLMPRTSIAEQMDEKMEKSILSSADEVIVVSRSQAENFRQITERGYRVITNGFDPDDFTSPAIDPGSNQTSSPVDQQSVDQQPVDQQSTDQQSIATDQKTEATGTSGFLIRHVGNIGEAAIPAAFLKTVKQLVKSVHLQLEFIGHVHSALPELADQMNLSEYVRFTDYLPHQQAIDRMCDSDALLLSIPDVESIEHHIPGKLFEYLGSGRPILMLGPEEGDCARIIREQGAGISAGFNDIESIRRAVTALIRGDIKSRPIAGGRHHPYSRRTLTKELSRLIIGENIY